MLCKVKDIVARMVMVTTPFNFISHIDSLQYRFKFDVGGHTLQSCELYQC